jgi:glycosyltransferase involved in cell wall biosynthesis
MKGRSICLVVTAEVTATTFYRGYLAYLRGLGWDVSLIASSEGGLDEFGESEGVAVFHVPMRREPSPLNDFISLIRLVRAIGRLKPDAVVTATPKAGLLGTFAALLLRVPVRVYQLWGIRLETESGIKRSILKRLESSSIRFSTQVVANSASLGRRADELGLLGDKRVVVLGPGSSHGVDIQRFSADASIPPVDSATRAFLSQDPAAFIVGFVGRVHPDKGIETLLDALELCEREGLRVRLLVVGGFESDAVVDRVRMSPVESHLVGAVSDTRPYLKVMDVHCLPTRREGFPNVVLEAAAMGLATIASDATGAVDSVLHEGTGLLFRTDDALDLATAVRRLAADTALRARLGANGRARARELYRQEKIWALQEENLRVQTNAAEFGSLRT